MRAPLALLPLLVAGVLALPAGAQELWLEIESPAPGHVREGAVPLLEIRGAAGVWGRHDVVLLLDVSGSTLMPSGSDVNGNGRVGRQLRSSRDPQRNYNPRRACSDSGDSIRAAEFEAARRLIASLDTRRTRVGFVVFAEKAQVLAPVGSTRSDLEAALERFARTGFAVSQSTHLAAGIDTARQELNAAPSEGARQRSILILSDGEPTLPHPPSLAEETALAASFVAAAGGVRIYSFAIGESVMEGTDVYRQIASQSGGEFAGVPEPGDIVTRLPEVDLAGLGGVRIENRTAASRGRALRVLPDGSFDAFVALVPGPNRIRVTATGRAGGTRSIERIVYYTRDAASSAETARLDRQLIERLRSRGVEMELADEIRRSRRQAQARLLELEPETLPDVAAPPP